MSAPLAIEMSASGPSRELTIRDLSGYGDQEMTLSSTPSALTGYALVECNDWDCRVSVGYSAMHMTASQMRAVAAFYEAAADQAEARA